MVLAVAVLALQLVSAVPAAAANGAIAVKTSVSALPAPAATVPNLPAVPLAGAPAPSTTVPTSGSTSNALEDKPQQRPAVLRAVSLDSSGNNTQTLSTIHIPETQPDKKPPIIAVQDTPSRRKWLMLAVAEHGAATFDAYSTRLAVSRGATEADPMMRPFAGSPGIYAAIQICPVVLDFAARRMQRSNNSFVRRTWWLPQSLGTGVYLFAGTHNMHVANDH